MDLRRGAGALAAEQQGVAAPEFEAVQRLRAARREQDQPAVAPLRRLQEFGPSGMAPEVGERPIIHRRAAHAGVGKREAAGLYDVHRGRQTGAQA